jgi:hypothetical protein
MRQIGNDKSFEVGIAGDTIADASEADELLHVGMDGSPGQPAGDGIHA